MAVQTTTLKEWWAAYDERDAQLDRLMQSLIVRKCSRCNKKYSFYKGEEDPRLCARCRGATDG